MNTSGWIKLYRKLMENEIWEKPSWWLKVWIYMLIRVNFEDTKRFVKGSAFISYDEIYLACKLDKEGIKKKAIQNVISWSTERQMLRTNKSTRGLTITILNYEIYQGDDEGVKDNNKDNLRTIKGQSKDTIGEELRIKNKEYIKEKINKKENGTNIPPELDEVKKYLADKKSNVDAERFYNFYASKGWFIGKNKMRNWHSAVATWERGSNERIPKNSQKNSEYDGIGRTV